MHDVRFPQQFCCRFMCYGMCLCITASLEYWKPTT